MENPYTTPKSSIEIERTPSQWWRWPLLPFACIFGSSLGAALVGGMQWFGMKFSGGYSEDGWYYLYVLPIVTSGFLGYFWAAIACEVAPRGKKITGIVMTTILGVLVVLTIIFSLLNPEYTTGQKVQSMLGGIAIIIAATVKLIEFQE